ncbi:MAG: hypothetical protein H7144_17175 [Burkholderiales bacterium]|nr:hypothetical protein [Phycisphaerae bacterium]
MVKRITRYTLLIACLLLAGAWGWSVGHVNSGYYWQETWSAHIHLMEGKLKLLKVYGAVASDCTFEFESESLQADVPLSDRVGLTVPDWGKDVFNILGPLTYVYIIVPLWTLLTPLLLITAWLWYPIIRKRLHGKRDTGFPVEIKQPEPVKE